MAWTRWLRWLTWAAEGRVTALEFSQRLGLVAVRTLEQFLEQILERGAIRRFESGVNGYTPLQER
jgi:hypothetical protein